MTVKGIVYGDKVSGKLYDEVDSFVGSLPVTVLGISNVTSPGKTWHIECFPGSAFSVYLY